jgi:hypothetical protein
VASVPDGALARIDGRLLGPTPLATDVVADEFHRIELEKAGFEPAARSLTPDDTAGAIVVRLQPESRPRALLFVDATTEGEVWLDGVDTGFAAPTVGLRVAPGVHAVEVRSDEGRRGVAHVAVRAGETTHLRVGPAVGAEP